MAMERSEVKPYDVSMTLAIRASTRAELRRLDQRLQAQLARRQERRGRPHCLVVVDEAQRVGHTGRLAVDLMATGREAGVSVVLASQGPSDLDELGRHLLARAAQDAAWTLMFRQGTLDSDRASRMLGVHLVEETAWRDQQEHTRPAERPWASASELEALRPGDALVRVPPVDERDVRVEHVRVALPRTGELLPPDRHAVCVSEVPSIRPALVEPHDPEHEVVIVPALPAPRGTCGNRSGNAGGNGSGPGNNSIAVEV
jgi:hypothetical protein